MSSPFVLLKTLKLKVPKRYNHATHLDSFKENYYEGHFDDYSPAITDSNFAKAHALTPGKVYVVKIFKITQLKVSSKDCLSFLIEKNAVLVGAQGLAVAWKRKRNSFPKGGWMVSLDEEENLWEVPLGRHGVPRIYRYQNVVRKNRWSDGREKWDFCLGRFEDPWNNNAINNYLLCICE